MRRARPRVTVIVVAAALVAIALTPSLVAAADPPFPGSIEINGGDLYTNQAVVTVATPATNAASMRLSTDGISWKTMPWAASTSWDVTDTAYGGSSTIGSKNVYVDFDDGTDTWDPAWSGGVAHVIFDDQGPTESQMRASFEPGRRITSGLVTMRITWLNDDHQQSGTQTYDLESRVDGGAWSPIATHPPLPGYFYAAAPGHFHQLQVRGVDYAGNAGDWYAGSAFGVSAFQDSSSRLSWKRSWSRVSSSPYWGGRAKSSATVGAKAKITFTGRMIALVSRVGPKRGALAVYVNGVRVDTVSLRASSNVYRRVVWTKWWSTSATRTVTFKVLSVPGSDRAEIDAVLTGN